MLLLVLLLLLVLVLVLLLCYYWSCSHYEHYNIYNNHHALGLLQFTVAESKLVLQTFKYVVIVLGFGPSRRAALFLLTSCLFAILHLLLHRVSQYQLL